MDKTKRRSINDSVRLTVTVRHEFSRRCCCCAYEINKTTGKLKESRTNDHWNNLNNIYVNPGFNHSIYKVLCEVII